MKTRIISGIIMVAIIAFVLITGYTLSPWAITAFIACVGAATTYELLHNAGGVKDVATIFVSCVYVVSTILLSQQTFELIWVPSVLYCGISAVLILMNHHNLDFGKIALIYGIPVPFVVAFCTLNAIINNANGIYQKFAKCPHFKNL